MLLMRVIAAATLVQLAVSSDTAPLHQAPSSTQTSGRIRVLRTLRGGCRGRDVARSPSSASQGSGGGGSNGAASVWPGSLRWPHCVSREEDEEVDMRIGADLVDRRAARHRTPFSGCGGRLRGGGRQEPGGAGGEEEDEEDDMRIGVDLVDRCAALTAALSKARKVDPKPSTLNPQPSTLNPKP